MPAPDQTQQPASNAWRAGRAVAKGAAIVLGSIVLLEVFLQLASLFAPSRADAWREGATHRILCVGDSHTWGAAVAREESYPSQLLGLLDAEAPQTYSVVNLGLPGMNTAQVRNRLPVWISRYQPDLVVVWAGMNNFWNVAEVDTEGESGTVWLESVALRSRLYRFARVWIHDRKLKRYRLQAQADRAYRITSTPPLQQGEATEPFIVQHDGVIEEVQHQSRPESGEDGEGRVAREGVRRVEADFAAIREFTRAAGADLVFITYPLEDGLFGVANAAIQRVGRRRDVPVIDSGEAVGRIPKEQQEWKWAAHPSGAMYREVALDLLPVVLDLKEARAGAP